ncbi:MAG: phosphatidylserine/phosphatidylglycerophosphate/cardiolipin synthase family protein [Planctomycetota bacterium]|nr:MAG: phosphatidylserine/phosphatidylglycerophosphate/cardiolipin synthase family protein [Planctomycetota bacterium]
MYKCCLDIVAVGSLLLCSCIHLPMTIDSAIGGVEGDIDELLDTYTNSHLDYGCDMQLLVDGEASYRAFVDLIESARDHVNIETLYFDDDSKYDWDVAMELALLLTEKVRQGVQVNVILDPLVQQYYAGSRIADVLREGGVNVVPYFPTWKEVCIELLLYRTHKKLMIVDGKQAIIGGMNFGYVYLAPDQWRDTNVLLTGPVVATMQREFLYDWELLGGSVGDEDRFFPSLTATGDLAVRSIDQRPAEYDFDINNMLLLTLRSAQEYIDIQAPYFNPSDWLLDELLQAAGRGIRIRILTNSDVSVDVIEAYYAAFFWFEILLNGGVEIYLWGLNERTLHSKAMVVDGRL